MTHTPFESEEEAIKWFNDTYGANTLCWSDESSANEEFISFVKSVFRSAYELGKKEEREKALKRLDDMKSFPAEMFQINNAKMPFVVFNGKATEQEKFQLFRLGFIDALSQIAHFINKQN